MRRQLNIISYCLDKMQAIGGVGMLEKIFNKVVRIERGGGYSVIARYRRSPSALIRGYF